jgi:signal transduction histidine kinase
MERHRTLITYLLAFLFAIGTAIRYLISFRGDPSLWTLTILLATFLLLLTIEPWLSQRSQRYTHFYLGVQSAITIAVSLTIPIVDFFTGLFYSLVLQAMYVFSPQTGFRWIGAFGVITAILTIHNLGWDVGLPLILMFVAGCFLIGSFIAIIRQVETSREEAETARQESQKLLAELQDAHEQLQAYTAQAEEMAVAAERNRLARELHDSVTQSLHSSTLMAAAGQRLADQGDLERANHYLTRLGEISQQALREMRLMVYELRPLALNQVGLVGALQQRLDTVERRAGVDARLVTVVGDGGEGQEVELPEDVEETLYWIAQEALNNALKHAQPSSVTVTLRMDDQVALEVADDGSGFDPGRVEGGGGIGLDIMRERAEKAGGTLSIHSAPGEGTRIEVTIG